MEQAMPAAATPVRARKSLLRAVCCLCASMGIFVLVSQYAMTQSTSDVDKLVKMNMDAWQTELAERVKVGASSAAVASIMAGKFRDKARIRWGGSGDYAMFYLIDDYTQVRIDFDANDEVISVPIVQKKGAWIRGPNGDLRIDPK